MRAQVIALRLARCPIKSVDRDKGQTVRPDVLAHLLHGHRVRKKLLPVRRIDAIKAGIGGRRTRDAEMHFGGSGVAHHLHDLFRRGAPHDGIVDENDALALDHRTIGIVL